MRYFPSLGLTGFALNLSVVCHSQHLNPHLTLVPGLGHLSQMEEHGLGVGQT